MAVKSISRIMLVKIFAHSGDCLEEAKEKVLNDILVFMGISNTNLVLINYETETLKDKIIASATIYYERKTVT